MHPIYIEHKRNELAFPPPVGDECSHGKHTKGAIEMGKKRNGKSTGAPLLAMILVVASYSYLLLAPASTSLSRAAAAIAMAAG